MSNEIQLWPFAVYTLSVFLIVAIMVILSHFLGQRHKEKETGEAYESGIMTTGTARLRISPQFYVIAMFFLIFDLEAVFIITWAIAFKEVGWVGYLGILVFIGILLVVLLYEWRIGALDYAVSGKKIVKKFKQLNKEVI
ncbi:MAG: NADH:ubiquinone oxidoreductase subunit A [Caldithrix sp.]|nr:NADH:ubiquinone oxidoreductase subunit A [Caldithrix sp.]